MNLYRGCTMPARMLTPLAGEMKQSSRMVLVADDDAKARMVLRKVLEDANFRVSEALDGLQAREFLERTPPDLMILDMKMPGLHGTEIIRYLTVKHSKLPVLIYSGYSEMKDGITVISYKHCEYMMKPSPLTEIVAKVKEMLGK